MKYNEMSELDLKIVLLGGGSIRVENLNVIPYKLGEIKDYGYTKYMKNLQWVSLSIDDFINSVLDLEKKIFLEQEKPNLKTFDFYIKLGGEELQKSLLRTLSMIFKTDDIRILSTGVIAIDFVKKGIITIDEYGEMTINEDVLESIGEDEITIITRDNFDDLTTVIKLQNYLEKPKSDKSEENPVDEETKMLQEHMKKMREKVEAKKNRQRQDDGESDIDISDIISAVSSKSNSINKLNIWELTLYQLYDEYARLELIDNYDLSIKAMMAGAEKVDLKHWSSKL
ncbi:hypothetical protein PQE75_gp225 [Bacillus phage vB_BcoS-136]|uniref:Uncharacterized protein n=1 Tax=Bacillus phage vB_BcoS-136 TaxID=2419619 RepID=A0A3G3BVJ9_9CAUD|nr:hypothetical protein PQE75_gp225 [Bacillus phage vB_BcoS-136]AYP68254.1 hypothetical protein vBBcoS136_00139 [Bacillus phage vB_BcoS-136]